MSDDLVFFDTNTLVYANDVSAADKQAKARELIHETIRAGQGTVSTQVLAEFWVTVTQKLKKPLDKDLAREQITLFSAFIIQAVDQATVLEALGIQERFKLSYWDAQILASAGLAGCAILYSEDLKDGGEYGKVKVINPFQSIHSSAKA
jgi:predicted nucleic acid-binding protein